MEDRKLAIIDADSIVWGTAYKQDKDLGASFREGLSNWLYEMFNFIGATHYIGIIGSEEPTFRKAINLDYKATRPPKPDFYNQYGEAIEYHLLTEWNFIQSTPGYEADDDVASIARICRSCKIPYVICSIDKDLQQIAGTHYNYRTKELTEVTEEQAKLNLLRQVLTGDRTDNIPGLPGVGPVKADKIMFENPSNSASAEESVVAAYVNKFGMEIGLAKFAETYLMVRLENCLPTYIEDTMQKIEYPVINTEND